MKPSRGRHPHRVRASKGRARYSAAYFCNPDYNTIVEPLPASISSEKAAQYRAISWSDFRRLRAMGDYGDYGEEVQVSHFKTWSLPVPSRA